MCFLDERQNRSTLIPRDVKWEQKSDMFITYNLQCKVVKECCILSCKGLTLQSEFNNLYNYNTTII